MGIGKINIAALGPKLLRYLIPTMIGLVSTQLVLMPFIFKKIYTQRPRSDERIVSYDRGELNFGTEFEFTQNGDIQLELFDAEYPSVTSRDGDKVVAPGTDGHDTVQFTNNVHGEISYTAVLYMIRDSEDLPVKAELMGVNFDDTDKYSLPDGVDQSQVIPAVSGKLSPDEVVNFELFWNWDFYESDERDTLDTFLGDKEESDNIILGMNLVVVDNNVYVAPETKTQKVVGYSFATAASAASTAALFLVYKKTKIGV